MAQDITPPKESSGGGIFDEWKKASPKEKMFILGGIGVVVLIMLYVYSKSKNSASSITGAGGASNGGGGGGIQTTPGGIPILPTGLCPQYNPTTGALESYGPCGTPGAGGGVGTKPPTTVPPIPGAGPKPPVPPAKPRPALPVSPVVKPRPVVPSQSTTTASVAARRTPTVSRQGLPGAPGRTRGNAGNQPLPTAINATGAYNGVFSSGLPRPMQPPPFPGATRRYY